MALTTVLIGSTNPFISPDTYGYGISPQLGLVGIVCILTGLYFMAFGFRCFRATLALTGFVIFGK
jgi:hypothetical protein